VPSVEQTPFREADSDSAVQDTVYIFMDPDTASRSHFRASPQSRFICVIFPSTSRSGKWPHPFPVSPRINVLCFSIDMRATYKPCHSNRLLFYYLQCYLAKNSLLYSSLHLPVTFFLVRVNHCCAYQHNNRSPF
jgi:hypothetical protein